MDLIKLKELYTSIHLCHLCPKMDKIKVQRDITAISNKTRVFIISQALAEGQLRLSGVNFFKPDGKSGNTGKHLEKFLNLINYTIFPAANIKLANGNFIEMHQHQFTPVYNTEVTQCFPGKAKRGDRLPLSSEISNCLSTKFLENEIMIIKPKLLVLMGSLSIETFYKYVLQEKLNKSVTELISQIVESNKIPETNFFGNPIGYIPIQHASGANPYYLPMLQNYRFINLINTYLSNE